jgi:hypothetical protein
MLSNLLLLLLSTFLSQVLKAYTKAVIRANPADIMSFSEQYFKEKLASSRSAGDGTEGEGILYIIYRISYMLYYNLGVSRIYEDYSNHIILYTICDMIKCHDFKSYFTLCKRKMLLENSLFCLQGSCIYAYKGLYCSI